MAERLGLSFHNANALHDKVDALPDDIPWESHNIIFNDRPNEKHLIQYRNVIDAIKALLGEPSLSKHIVYRPSRIFTDQSRRRRIYSEMWTGTWWSAVQVSKLFLPSLINIYADLAFF